MHWRNARHLLLGAAMCAAIPLIVHARQDDQVFKSGAELVVLHVNVFDKRSDAVPELPQSAFTVFEDDKAAGHRVFSAGDVPVTVGLVIDNSTSMLTEREMVVSGATAFAESSHPEDEMFAIVFNEHVRTGLPDTIDFTKNRMQLRASLQRFPPGGKRRSMTPSSRASIISRKARLPEARPRRDERRRRQREPAHREGDARSRVEQQRARLHRARSQRRRPRRKQAAGTAPAREAVGRRRLLPKERAATSSRISRTSPGISAAATASATCRRAPSIVTTSGIA